MNFHAMHFPFFIDRIQSPLVGFFGALRVNRMPLIESQFIIVWRDFDQPSALCVHTPMTKGGKRECWREPNHEMMMKNVMCRSLSWLASYDIVRSSTASEKNLVHFARMCDQVDDVFGLSLPVNWLEAWVDEWKRQKHKRLQNAQKEISLSSRWRWWCKVKKLKKMKYS